MSPRKWSESLGSLVGCLLGGLEVGPATKWVLLFVYSGADLMTEFTALSHTSGDAGVGPGRSPEDACHMWP